MSIISHSVNIFSKFALQKFEINYFKLVIWQKETYSNSFSQNFLIDKITKLIEKELFDARNIIIPFQLLLLQGVNIFFT